MLDVGFAQLPILGFYLSHSDECVLRTFVMGPGGRGAGGLRGLRVLGPPARRCWLACAGWHWGSVGCAVVVVLAGLCGGCRSSTNRIPDPNDINIYRAKEVREYGDDRLTKAGSWRVGRPGFRASIRLDVCLPGLQERGSCQLQCVEWIAPDAQRSHGWDSSPYFSGWDFLPSLPFGGLTWKPR